MTQEERRAYLIRALEKEMPSYGDYGVPEDEEAQRKLLRALFNVRLPSAASPSFLAVQDAYLAERTREKGITESGDLLPAGKDTRLVLWQGDITTLRCDAIVNAANSGMTGCYRPLHGCIDNIIHTMAGVQLRAECERQMEELRRKSGPGYAQPTAVPMITPGFNLPAKHVIHVVGPVVEGMLTDTHRAQLAECYRACLSLAADNGCRSIAFCCISTGVFRFPADEAARIAVETVSAWLDAHPDRRMRKVIFNVFKDSDRILYAQQLSR